MVDLELLQSVSYIAGALGVCVAAIYYVMNLRMVQKKMAVDTAILYGNLITAKEPVNEWRHFFLEADFTSFEDWAKRYRTDPKEFQNWYTVMGTANQIGLLLKEKVIDPEMLMTLISPVWPKYMWARGGPVIKGYRIYLNDPKFGYYGEYFFNEAERMYPKVKMPIDSP